MAPCEGHRTHARGEVCALKLHQQQRHLGEGVVPRVDEVAVHAQPHVRGRAVQLGGFLLPYLELRRFIGAESQAAADKANQCTREPELATQQHTRRHRLQQLTRYE